MLFFIDSNIASHILVPLVTQLTATMVAAYYSTGGVMYSSFSGVSSLYYVLPCLALIYPLSVGQPWIGLSMAVVFSWVAVFYWSWVDPAKRTMVTPKLFSLLLMLLSYSATTMEVGWATITNLFIFWSVMTGSILLTTLLSEPLCVIVPQHLSVAVYNVGVILDAVTEPLKAHARSEALPHFLVEHPMSSLADLRSKHMSHHEEVVLLMRELPFEASFAEEEAARNRVLLDAYVLLNDCMSSIAAFASRGIAYNLYDVHWKILAPKMDEYAGHIREYLTQVNIALLAMYSGNGHKPSFKDIRAKCHAARRELFEAYTLQLKRGKVTIDGTPITTSSNMDHWVFMTMQLWKAINRLAVHVEREALDTSHLGWKWRIAYHTKALFMPAILMAVSVTFMLRTLLKMTAMFTKTIFHKCCGQCAHHNSEEIDDAAPSTMTTTQTDNDVKDDEVIPQTMGGKDTESIPTSSTAATASTSNATGTPIPRIGELRKIRESAAQILKADREKDQEAVNSVENGGNPLSSSSSSSANESLRNQSSSTIRSSLDDRMPRDSIAIDVDLSLPSSSSDGADSSTSHNALKHEKHMQFLWHQSLYETAPQTVLWEEYMSEGRWKFPVRFVLVITPVAFFSVAISLYWTPTVNTALTIPSAVIVMMATVGASWRRFLQRALGTFTGALLGQLTVIVCSVTHRFVCWGPLILVTWITTYAQFGLNARYSYFYLITSLTYSIVLLGAYPFTSGVQVGWYTATYRFLFVFIGSLIGTLASFIFPEYSLQRYLSVVRAVFVSAQKAVHHIHDHLATNARMEKHGELEELATQMTTLHATAIATRYDAAAETLFHTELVDAIRLLRYKIRDMCFTTRLQIFSATTGFGSNLQTTHTDVFIQEGQQVNDNISYEVEYIDYQLDQQRNKRLRRVPLETTTEGVAQDFADLECKVQEVKTTLSPHDGMQLSSHITLFRLFCVILHDVARTADHYF